MSMSHLSRLLARTLCAALALSAALGVRAHAAEADALEPHHVQYLLLLRCAACHGAQRQEGGLDVRSVESLLRGGKSGPAIVPGDPENSLLIRRIRAGEMPPLRQLVTVSIKPIEELETERLAQWIAAGAPAPAAVALPTQEFTEEEQDWWSFQPPVRPELPAVEHADQIRNPIDAFVLARLETAGLQFGPEAERGALARRVWFDLTGLPPDPAELQAFLGDSAEDAYERLVDRLLASPHYGERWARFWLDLAGYSDSDGIQHADPVRPFNWRYRDYVIRAFNQDKSYSQFLLEQLAGDELFDFTHAETITAEEADVLAATAFLRQAPDGTSAGITGFVPDRWEVMSAEIEVLSSSVMGLTFRCARCHDHKFDPLSQRDFYSLAALLKGAYDEHDWLKPGSADPGLEAQGIRNLPYVASDEYAAWEQTTASLNTQIATLEESLAARATETLTRLQQTYLENQPNEVQSTLAAALAKPTEERTAEDQALLAAHPGLPTAREQLAGLDADFAASEKSTQEQVSGLRGQLPMQPLVSAVWDRGRPSPTFVLNRGNYLQPKEPVEPAIPGVLVDRTQPLAISPPWSGATSTGRRLALARWLTQDNHPLTARVLVNRIWQQHFGRGIVRSLDNFGRTGALPSHPELLDWLATELPAEGWRLKQLHRLIVTSRTYRQASLPTSEALAADPDNALWSRFPRRRLEAEQLYDALIFVSGRLIDRPFGRPDPVETRPDGLTSPVAKEGGYRRSIYLMQRRTQVSTFHETFDLPRMGPNCNERSVSIVSPQALQLLNNPLVRNLAGALAQRVTKEAGTDRTAQLQRLWQLAYARPATEEEMQLCAGALDAAVAAWREKTPQASEAELQLAALGDVVHAILNSAEFLWLD